LRFLEYFPLTYGFSIANSHPHSVSLSFLKLESQVLASGRPSATFFPLAQTSSQAIDVAVYLYCSVALLLFDVNGTPCLWHLGLYFHVQSYHILRKA